MSTGLPANAFPARLKGSASDGAAWGCSKCGKPLALGAALKEGGVVVMVSCLCDTLLAKPVFDADSDALDVLCWRLRDQASAAIYLLTRKA